MSNLIKACSYHRDRIALYESDDQLPKTLTLCSKLNLPTMFHIRTSPGCSTLQSPQVIEDHWLALQDDKIIHCAGGYLQNDGDESNKSMLFGGCLGNTVMRLRKKGYACHLLRDAIYY